MMKTRLIKVTSLAACVSLLMALPVFAGTSQSGQSDRNMLMQLMQNGMQGSRMTMQNGMQDMQNDMQGGQTRNSQRSAESQQLSSAAWFMVDKGIIKGSSSGSYDMSNNVKRGDMSLMLMRAFNFGSSSDNSGNGFSDVSRDSYYYDAVNTMQDLGIAKGDGQNFRPGSYMTLQEAVLFVERALSAAGIDYSEPDLTSLFSDRSLSEYATRDDVSKILYAVLGSDDAAVLSGEIATSDAISYEADENDTVTLDRSDFNDACDSATGADLSYVKFTLPSANYGKLYYDYTSSDDYESKVASTEKYYYSADDDELALSGVTFVPKDGFTGTVKIPYVGVNEDGDTFTGTIKITVD